MSEIQFQDEYRYSPERNAIEFQAWEDGRQLVCEIAADALAALADANPADDSALVIAFRRHRAELQNIAERLIRIGVTTKSGRVLISEAMLADC